MSPKTEVALHKYFRDQIGRPFKFGEHDCLLVALGALDIISGKNLRQEYSGLWHDKKSAYKYAEDHQTSIKQILMDAGCKTVDQTRLRTGDFLLTEAHDNYDEGWRSATTYIGGGKVAAMGLRNGLEIVKLNRLIGIKEVLRWA